MISFVIQGPLVTFGQGPNNSSVGFNTYESIVANVERIDKMNSDYIVVTWLPKNDNEQNILDRLLAKDIKVITINPPILEDPDHRYKHHYGISEGIKSLNIKVDFIVKIRTDQTYKTEFFEYMISLHKSNTNKLCVSELYNHPFFIGDFIYAAEKKVFLNFVNGFLKFQSFKYHPCLAMDIGMKYCHAIGFREFNKYFPTFYYFVFRADYIRELWNSFIQKHVVVIPANVRDDILWRDRRIGDIVDSSYFKFDTKPILENIEFFTRLVSYLRHWKIYLLKKHPTVAKVFNSIKSVIKRIIRK